VLGEGGHGLVVAAQHMQLNERVAIKLLRDEVAQDPETVARFLREARASVRIKGEHVTRVLDVGSLPSGMPYMVMEHLTGSDLASIVETKGWLPLSLAIDYVLQTCEALAEAHGIGIVHRDIKPSNLFVTTRPDGSPCIKVLDFGISKAIPSVDGSTPQDEMNLTQTQTVLGSPQYMAPEQMRSSKRVDGRTDIWAIGTTLHELLTGHPPFQAKTMPELFAMILQDAPPKLSESRPEIPPALEIVVARCLEKEPEKRYSNVAELARALAPFASSTGLTAADRVGRVGFNAAQSSRHSSYMQFEEGSSMRGIDSSRTEKTGNPFGKTRSMFLLATGGAFSLALAGLAIFFVVHSVRGRSSQEQTPAGIVSPAASSVAGTTTAASAMVSALPPPPPPPPEDPPPSVTASAGKKRLPSGQKHAAASASASSAPAPPPPATVTATARPPGVASSRYD